MSDETTIWHGKPEKDAGVSGAGFSALRSLKRGLIEEQRDGWERGCPAEPEDFLGRWPVDPESDPDAANLLVEDFLRRRARGDEPDLDEYSRRLPAQRGSLVGLVSLRSALESVRGAGASAGGRLLRLPDVGDEL